MGCSGGAFRDQVIGTAILLMPILALTDLPDNPPRADLAHCVIGLVVTATGMAFGADAGYAIDPARDPGPRPAGHLTGYGTARRDQWGNLHWWAPIAGPLIGGPAGAALYKLFIGFFPHTAGPEPPGRVPAPEG